MAVKAQPLGHQVTKKDNNFSININKFSFPVAELYQCLGGDG